MADNDLIYRNDLLAAYDAAHKGPPGGARKLMEEAPAVDAAPVVHGRWICLSLPEYQDDFRKYGGLVYWMCNKCHRAVRFVNQDLPYEFCPHCGARMDADSPTCGPDYCEIGGGNDAR